MGLFLMHLFSLRGLCPHVFRQRQDSLLNATTASSVKTEPSSQCNDIKTYALAVIVKKIISQSFLYTNSCKPNRNVHGPFHFLLDLLDESNVQWTFECFYGSIGSNGHIPIESTLVSNKHAVDEANTS